MQKLNAVYDLKLNPQTEKGLLGDKQMKFCSLPTLTSWS